MKRGIFVAVALPLAAAVWMSTAVQSGAEEKTPATEMQLLERIERSGTAADHRALADFYRNAAQAADAQAADHEMMAQRYAKLGGKVDWATHCRNIASHYKKVAAEDRELATMHETEAAKLGGN